MGIQCRVLIVEFSKIDDAWSVLVVCEFSCARRIVRDWAKVRPCSLLFCVMLLCVSCARERFILCQRESACERERETDRGKKKRPERQTQRE